MCAKERKPKPPIELSIWSAEAKDLHAAVISGTPLACALIGGAFLEKALATLLHEYFIECSTANKLLSYNGGTLGTMQAKADVAYALGMISKPMYKNICKVGEIRNKFAHSHSYIDFESTEIKQLLSELEQPAFVGSARAVRKAAARAKESSPQHLFTSVILLLGMKFEGIRARMKRRPPSDEPWELHVSEID